MTCSQCGGCRWVCESHPEGPWLGEHACNCGAPGMPCPACDGGDELTPPKLPPGFVDDDYATRH